MATSRNAVMSVASFAVMPKPGTSTTTAEMLAHMLLHEMEFERRETKRQTLGE